jgi:hypothetical protein
MSQSSPKKPLMLAARRLSLALSLSLSTATLLAQAACASGAASQGEPAAAGAEGASTKTSPGAESTAPTTAGAPSASPSGQAAPPAIAPPLDAQAVQKACGDAPHFMCGLKLGKELNLSKTENGYTVKVTRVYADAAYLILQYEVAPPAGDKSDPGSIEPQLSVRMLPVDHIIPRENIGGPPPPPPPAGQLTPISASGGGGPVGAQQFHYYDIGDWKSHPSTLSFNLTVFVMKAAPSPPSAGSPGAQPVPPEQLAHPPKGSRAPGPPRSPSAPPGPAAPPMPPPPPPVAIVSFDISVPLQPSQVLDLKQSQSAGGVTYSLERVIATPLVTQFYIKKQRPATKARPTALMPGEEVAVDVSAGGFNAKGVGSGSMTNVLSKSEGWTVPQLIGPSLFGKEGEWTLTVNEFNCGDGPCPRDRKAGGFALDLAKTKKVAGPFEFKFTPPRPAQ